MMKDKLTEKIVEQLDELPIVKKKAILELIKKNSFSREVKPDLLQNEWRKQLLTISVWTDEEINEIIEAREYINKWTLEQFL